MVPRNHQDKHTEQGGGGGGGGSCRRGSTVYCYDKYVSIMFDLSSFINVCTYIV